MRRVTLILSLVAVLILSGCGCLMSQVPPQTNYINESCEGVVPDYLPLFTFSDNCEIDTVFQDPAPGYVLTAATPRITMQVFAVDIFNNLSSVAFEVSIIDTICPEISYQGTIVARDPVDTLYFPDYQTPKLYFTKR
jgi:hypothetical protein